MTSSACDGTGRPQRRRQEHLWGRFSGRQVRQRRRMFDEIRNAYVAITLRVDAGTSVFDYFIRLLGANADPKRRPGGRPLGVADAFGRSFCYFFERENEKVTLGRWKTQPQTINLGRDPHVFGHLWPCFLPIQVPLSLFDRFCPLWRGSATIPWSTKWTTTRLELRQDEYDAWLAQFQRNGATPSRRFVFASCTCL